MIRSARRLVVHGVVEALATLRRNPLRTALAALAMAAAVATAAVVQTGLDGLAASARVTSARAFGTDAFIIARVASSGLSRRELAERSARNPNVTRRDARFLDRVAAGRVVYAATAQRQADVTAGGRTFEFATVSGAEATLPAIRDLGIDRGRFFTLDEDTSGAPVAVLGRAVIDEIFPGRDPVGQAVRIGGRRFDVVGTLLPQGTSGGQSLDRFVWMPLTAFERTFGAPASLQILAAAPTGVSTMAAEDRARVSMRARRQLAPGAADTFDIITPQASRSFVDALTERLGAAGPPISLMALLAAMVVVLNTTLVSVAQRTRDIGVRRAVGASRTSVLAETLAEAVLVAVLGGAVGLTLATGVLAVAEGPLGVPLALGWPVAAASLAAAAASGLAAGWLPARRAAAIDVVQALRQE